MSRARKPDESFAAKLKRWAVDFDAWVSRQVGKLSPRGRRQLAIVLGVCAVASLLVGGIVELQMRAAGTLKEDDSPFASGVGFAVLLVYLIVKALIYKPPPLTAAQLRQQQLTVAWTSEREPQSQPWAQFMAWPESRGTQVAVLIIRRSPDGTLDAEVSETLSGDTSADEAAELMWQVRARAEQAEVDAIAEYELGERRQREAVAARQDADGRAREQAELAEKSAREASELAAAQARDARVEAEGLAAAMRGTRKRRT